MEIQSQTRRPSSQLIPILLVLGIAFMGMALQEYNGVHNFDPGILLSIAVVLVSGALFCPDRVRPGWFNPIVHALVCSFAISADLIQLWRKDPIDFAPIPWHFQSAVVLMGLAAALGCSFAAMRGSLYQVPLIGIFAVTSIWLLRQPETPFIDVNVVTHDACEALSHGQNPYAIDFRDIYADNPDFDRRFNAPGAVVNGRVKYGYQYMPLSLAVAEVGYLLGDFRYGNLLALSAAAWLLAMSGTRWHSAVAATLLLLTPRVFYILEAGWSEPVVILCLAAVVYASERKPRLLPLAVGLLLVSKQHLVLLFPLTWMLIPDIRRPRQLIHFCVKAVTTGAVVTLPLVLWNIHAFWHSAVESLAHNLFRPDSLNVAAWWVSRGHLPPPAWCGYLLAALAMAICLVRLPRSTFGFCLAATVTYLAFFALAKQAFTNYYFLTVATLCCALATWNPAPSGAQR